MSTYIWVCVDLQQSNAFAGLLSGAPLALINGNPILANGGEHLRLASVQERIELHSEDLMVVVLADMGAAMHPGYKHYDLCSAWKNHTYICTRAEPFWVP